MTFKITSAQLNQLDALIKNKSSLTSAEAAQGYSWLFQWTSNVAGTDRAEGMDLAVWTWIKGAKDVNKGVGKFSWFIREYTAAQYQIRTGKTLAAGNIQEASNAIALSVLKDISDNKGTIPTLRRLGEKDAANTVGNILANTPALWSGNVLFTFLGDGSFFNENILTKKGDILDSYDFFAAYVSFLKAYKAAFGTITSLNLIVAASTIVQAISPLLLLEGIGIQYSTILSTNNFIQKLYGSTYVFLNIFTYPSLLNDIVLGTRENDTISTFDAKVDYVQAGEGNDTIIGSTVNSLVRSDLIDGGFGNDTVSFATATNKLNVIVGKDPKLTQYTARVSQGTIFSYLNTSVLYNIEKIIGSNQNDLFDIREMPPTLTLDGGAGNDTLDFSNAKSAVTIDSKTSNATFQGKKLIYSNFETFSGSKLNDTFTLDNTAKKVDGGAGKDLLSFANSTAGVIVNDSTKTGNIVAQNIEEYVGSSSNDRIIGSIANEVFRDGNGNDVIFGQSAMVGAGGNDTFYAGQGDDIFASGDLGDTFIFQGSYGHDAINFADKGIAIKIGNIDLSTVKWNLKTMGIYTEASGTLTLIRDSKHVQIFDKSGNDVFLGNAISNGLFTL